MLIKIPMNEFAEATIVVMKLRTAVIVNIKTPVTSRSGDCRKVHADITRFKNDLD